MTKSHICKEMRGGIEKLREWNEDVLIEVEKTKKTGNIEPAIDARDKLIIKYRTLRGILPQSIEMEANNLFE
ncbi:hypothetical protein HON36_04310 [Candidatus Parcubacteria bacterium]|jgi:hypothetical protein|nr:hypothetical protein [Candidatus Parcubacteria bacterium]MBT7228495.1 hypothetical protein [Candidatus Parcubacteria bacterium]